MTIDDLKRVISFSIPMGLTTDKQLVFCFEALATSAEMQGIELTSKRKTFAQLREMGFASARRDGENMIAVPLLTYAAIIIPVLKEITAEVLAERETSK